MLDLLDEFPRFAVGMNPQCPFFQGNLPVAGGKGTHEDHLFRVLADVDEAPGAGEPGAEFRDIEVALAVGLGQPQEGNIESTTVVEVELAGLIDDRLGIDGGAEAETPRRDSPHHSGFGGEGDEIQDVLLGRHGGHALGHADAQVHHVVGGEFQGRAAGDNLALVQAHGRDGGQRHPDLPRESGAIGLAEGLHVVLGPLRDYHAIDQDPGDLDLPGVEAMAVGKALDLGNDEATRIMDGHGDSLGLQRQGLALHGDIALRVGGGAANEADLDREGLVKQILIAVDLHQAHQIDAAGEGPVVELAATQAGIDEGAQADPRQGPGLAGGDVAEEVADDTLGQIPGLDAIGEGQLLQLGNQTPMATDHPPHQTLMAQVVETSLLAVALTRGIDQGQVAGMTEPLGIVVLTFQKALLQSQGQILWKANADETASGQGIAVADQAHRLPGADHLAGIASVQRGNQGVLGHGEAWGMAGERGQCIIPFRPIHANRNPP